MWGLLLSFLQWAHCSPIPFFANLIGTTVPALNLLVSILMGYPLAIFYHKYVIKYNEYRNLYFIVTGLDIAFFNFGFTLYHNLIPAVVFYAITFQFGPGKINSLITFVFNMTYLLGGYIVTESEDYDITWTMPHCVLTLKLMALSFDLWDGQKLKNGLELSENSKKTAVVTPPTIIELIGFVFFPACFLVGPIFSFRRYKDFVGGMFPLNTEADTYEKRALTKLAQGVLYLVAFQVGVSVFSINYMQSDEFWDESIFYRHLYCGLWAHFALYKYISCWLLTEASCIRFGLSYNGTTEIDGQKQSKWDGCNNIKLLKFEGATKFQHYIDSFNCNTNHFAAEYVYKRLKFLGNRNMSQLLTLLFLSFWHGTWSGYFVTFFNEFIIIIMEKEFESIISKTELYNVLWSNRITSCLLYVVLKLYTIVFMGWSLVPFDLKIWNKWLTVYSSLYFSGFILFVPWSFVYKPLIIKGLKYFNVAIHDKKQ